MAERRNRSSLDDQPVATGAFGTVTRYRDDKGFGFITPDDGSDDLFAHVTNLDPDANWPTNRYGEIMLKEGGRVEFDVFETDRGFEARNIGPSDTPAPEGMAARVDAGRGERGGARGGARRDEGELVASDVEGAFKWFSTQKGFGFVAPDDGSADLFAHMRSLDPNSAWAINRFDELAPAEGERVIFDTYRTQKGTEARNIRLA